MWKEVTVKKLHNNEQWVLCIKFNTSLFYYGNFATEKQGHFIVCWNYLVNYNNKCKQQSKNPNSYINALNCFLLDMAVFVKESSLPATSI